MTATPARNTVAQHIVKPTAAGPKNAEIHIARKGTVSAAKRDDVVIEAAPNEKAQRTVQADARQRKPTQMIASLRVTGKQVPLILPRPASRGFGGVQAVPFAK